MRIKVKINNYNLYNDFRWECKLKNFSLKTFSFLVSFFATLVAHAQSSSGSINQLNKIPFLTNVAVVDQTRDEALADAKEIALNAIIDHCGPSSGKLRTFKIIRTHLMSENPELPFDYLTIEGEYECFITQ